ncbi:MAG: hypothetical protein M1813_008664 [Trichoglossum hirsutum]|nr:MAG: hypothetical protein M1813_008664 [Trichoglossum hirsutum]
MATEYDEEHERLEYISQNNNNDYTLGRVGNHNVVIAVLPDGEYGTVAAASVARDMLYSFPDIRIYDFSKTIQDQNFQVTDLLNQPPMVLQMVVNRLKAQYERMGNGLEEIIKAITIMKEMTDQNFLLYQVRLLFLPLVKKLAKNSSDQL